MVDMTPREILDAVHGGLDETALLTALGYDAATGRPGRHLLNNALERLGYGRPIDDQGIDRMAPYQPYPDEWIRVITRVVCGRSDAPIRDVIAALKKRAASRTAA